MEYEEHHLITLDEEHDELGSVDLKLIGSDLPCPNLAEEDSYGGGRVKKSASDEVEAVKLFLTGDDGGTGGARVGKL